MERRVGPCIVTRCNLSRVGFDSLPLSVLPAEKPKSRFLKFSQNEIAMNSAHIIINIHTDIGKINFAPRKKPHPEDGMANLHSVNPVISGLAGVVMQIPATFRVRTLTNLSSHSVLHVSSF